MGQRIPENPGCVGKKSEALNVEAGERGAAVWNGEKGGQSYLAFEL